MNHLIIGGARSGKSRYAQQLAARAGLDVIYIATATADDDEMRARIQQHQQQRPAHWQLVEEPVQLANVLLLQAASDRVLLVDCLTLWLSNLLAQRDSTLLKSECDKLVNIIPDLPCQLILVSNEVGQGIVPANALARRFIDEAGWLHQRLAEVCSTVTIMTAGLPQTLKPL